VRGGAGWPLRGMWVLCGIWVLCESQDGRRPGCCASTACKPEQSCCLSQEQVLGSDVRGGKQAQAQAASRQAEAALASQRMKVATLSPQVGPPLPGPHSGPPARFKKSRQAGSATLLSSASMQWSL
jgi:hypothetical protein